MPVITNLDSLVDTAVEARVLALDATLTTLSFAGNTLTYVDEQGSSNAIDLTMYLDDTNLARITNGTLSNGTLTVTRDDTSTFDIDLSALLDDTVLSDAEVKTAYENNTNTNAYTDTEKSKLAAIEEGATVDQTKSDIDALAIDSATVNGLAVETAVPVGAVFTDTTYSNAEIKTKYENNVEEI